ncbi:MAG TPA: hypothetical protein VGM29_00315 [Polyangiaceae bacterium]
MKPRSLLALFALWLPLFVTHAARAEEADAPKSKDKSSDREAKPSDKDDNFGHRFQFGLRAGLVGGYEMDFRYDHSPFCKAFVPSADVKDQQKFCGHGSPLAIDAALSFALLDFIEPFLWGRFGLGADSHTDTKPLMLYGVGARIYTMSDSAFKIFLEPAVAWEVEGGRGNAAWQENAPVYKKDAIFHLAVGPQLDLAKQFGVYLDAGLTTGILRSIHTTLELQGGLQLRGP